MARVKKQVDPITIATSWHYLQRVCREMRDTVERTATNVLITPLHDMAYGIWDAYGRAVAIPEGFPCRLISSSFPIRAVIKQFAGQIHPGDVFLLACHLAHRERRRTQVGEHSENGHVGQGS